MLGRSLGLFDAFPTRARGGEGALAPKRRTPHDHDQTRESCLFPSFFPPFFYLRHQFRRKSDFGRLAVGASRKKRKYNSPRFGRDHVVCGCSGLKPLRRRAPVGGHHWSRGTTFLGSYYQETTSKEINCGDFLARGYMPAHQLCDLFYTLGWGSDWVYHKLGNTLVLRSGTGSWVLSG